MGAGGAAVVTGAGGGIADAAAGVARDARWPAGIGRIRSLNIPVVLIGNLGGALHQGQYLHYANRTQGDLLLTLARVAGATTFGDPAIATAPLTELLAP